VSVHATRGKPTKLQPLIWAIDVFVSRPTPRFCQQLKPCTTRFSTRASAGPLNRRNHDAGVASAVLVHSTLS